MTSIKDKSILEIGPGTGNLTSLIIEKKPKEFCVVEKDNDLAKELAQKYKNIGLYKNAESFFLRSAKIYDELPFKHYYKNSIFIYSGRNYKAVEGMSLIHICRCGRIER